MDIGNSIRRSQKQQAIIKSLAWNSIVEVFQEEKQIDISEYMGSIQIKGNTLLIKTTKSILKSELILLDNLIKNRINEKYKKVGIKFYKIDLKYL